MGKTQKGGSGFSAAKLAPTPKQSATRAPEAHAAKEKRAVALINQGKLQEAEAIYRELIAAGTTNHIAHGNLAAICGMQGRFDELIELLKKTLEIKPNHPDAHNNLGIALKEQGDLEAAVASYNKALELKPNFPEAYYNLGNTLKEQGDLTAAIASYNKALELKPDYPDARQNLSTAELMAGDFKGGLERYECRLNSKSDKHIHAKPLCKKWNGTKLDTDDHLLLVSEQGLGDTLQFMRYAIALRKQGLRVSLCAQPKLHLLIQASGIDPSPLTPEQAAAFTDGHWIPLLSVPRHLEVSPKNPIITEPYIRTIDELTTKWQGILANEQRPVIGINWQGNPDHEKINSIGRSLPLETFAPIAKQTNGALLSLQKGFGSEQLETCSFRDHFVSCQQLVDETWDFLETAAIIANCDLVITSDTSVAHLAGGMGKITWPLLKKVPEWRWGLEGDTTFWYPSMRLFRQRERGNWDEVLERVAEALREQFPEINTLPTSAPDAGRLQNNNKECQPRNIDLRELHIYCISLKGATKRREEIAKIKEDQALNIQFIDAIDERCIPRNEIQQLTTIPIQWDGLGGCRDEIKLSAEAACCLSHIKAWETILKLGLDHAIIIEDDIAIKRLGEIIIPDQADFAYLSVRASHNGNRKATGPLGGAEAYYLTKDCCKQLLGIFSTIRMPMDIQWLPQIESLIKTKHFLSAFTDEKLPTMNAYADPGILSPSGLSHTSQIRGATSQKKTAPCNIQAPISLGELIDKITILQIKTKHIQGAALENVQKELSALQETLDALDLQVDPILIQRLKEVNADLWAIEDDIRDQERNKNFGEDFIRLARSVYQQNDRRAAIKKEINTTYGSALVEEKSYQDY